MIFMKKEREGWMEIKRADVVVFSHLLLLILCIVSFSYTFSFSFSLLSFSVSGKKKFCFVHGLSSWMTPSLDIASRSFMSSFLKDFLFSMSFSCNERGRERGRERHRFTFVKKDSYQEESSCLVFLDILWKKRLCAAFKCVSPFIAWIPFEGCEQMIKWQTLQEKDLKDGSHEKDDNRILYLQILFFIPLYSYSCTFFD